MNSGTGRRKAIIILDNIVIIVFVLSIAISVAVSNIYDIRTNARLNRDLGAEELEQYLTADNVLREEPNSTFLQLGNTPLEVRNDNNVLIFKIGTREERFYSTDFTALVDDKLLITLYKSEKYGERYELWDVNDLIEFAGVARAWDAVLMPISSASILLLLILTIWRIVLRIRFGKWSEHRQRASIPVDPEIAEMMMRLSNTAAALDGDKEALERVAAAGAETTESIAASVDEPVSGVITEEPELEEKLFKFEIPIEMELSSMFENTWQTIEKMADMVKTWDDTNNVLDKVLTNMDAWITAFKANTNIAYIDGMMNFAVNDTLQSSNTKAKDFSDACDVVNAGSTYFFIVSEPGSGVLKVIAKIIW